WSGLLMVIINILIAIIPVQILLSRVDRNWYNAISIYIAYSCVSARMLHYEAFKVKKALSESLAAGRKRLSYIVGRETDNLTRAEIVQATVETVAENTSDGVIAPLFYMIIFGPIGGLVYKFVNTMDSMVGYKNEKYRYIGYYPARIDDLFNYIPARITALLMCMSSILGFDVERGFRTMMRDGRKHSSPNAGYPEAAVAGLLGIELGGGNYYNGVFVEKPTIGRPEKKIEMRDINRTVYIMYRTEALFLMIYAIFISMV
ncbi:MAG: cobalamin biosynthesis protein CobD, partial [Tissierellia bacterium]|nr:cobalamin biosynthesis protein CobD [Tissierellia bacterium]